MSLSRNTAANLIGRLWATLLGIILIPIYLNLLGLESFALIGFWTALQGMFGLMDFGFGAAFGREVARLSASPRTEQEQRDLFATFNIIYWLLGLATFLLIWTLAPLIATNWVHAEKLSNEALVISIRLMGIAIALQFPTGLYQGALLAMQRQVIYNTIFIVTATIRGLGTIVVLWLIASTIQGFFLWQAILTALSVGLHWLVLNHLLPRGQNPSGFRFGSIAKIWRYALGYSVNTIGIFFSQQLDKVILSKTLSLEQFGYYTLAGTVATLLWTCVSAVSAAAIPRFNRSIAVGDEEDLVREYDRANQLLATILLPLSAVLLFFARDVMTIWTWKPDIAMATEHLVMVFVIGMSLIGIVNMALQIALGYGWFRLTLGFTWGTALISAPLYWFASARWGVLGAGVIWMLQNAVYLLIIPLLHRRYLRGAGMKWLRYSFVSPILAAGMVCGAMRLLVTPAASQPGFVVAMLGLTWVLATVAVIVVEPSVRVEILAACSKFRTAPDRV